MREDFEITDRVKYIVELLSEEDPKAERIVWDLINNDPMLIFIINDMNIRGQQLVEALRICDNSFKRLTLKLKARDKGFIAYLNSITQSGHVARVSGGPNAS